MADQTFTQEELAAMIAAAVAAEKEAAEKAAAEEKEPTMAELLQMLKATGLITETGNIRKDIRSSLKSEPVTKARVLVAKSKVVTVAFYCSNKACRKEIQVGSEKSLPPGSEMVCKHCNHRSKVGKRAYIDEFRVGNGGDWTN